MYHIWQLSPRKVGDSCWNRCCANSEKCKNSCTSPTVFCHYWGTLLKTRRRKCQSQFITNHMHPSIFLFFLFPFLIYFLLTYRSRHLSLTHHVNIPDVFVACSRCHENMSIDLTSKGNINCFKLKPKQKQKTDKKKLNCSEWSSFYVAAIQFLELHGHSVPWLDSRLSFPLRK